MSQEEMVVINSLVDAIKDLTNEVKAINKNSVDIEGRPVSTNLWLLVKTINSVINHDGKTADSALNVENSVLHDTPVL